MTRAGRPRDASADDRIIDAALQVLAERGFEGFSVERVASESGIAKSTIYRRFATREDLVAGVLDRISSDFVKPPEGVDARTSLVCLLDRVRQAPGSVSGRILMHASAEGVRNPRLAALVHERVLRPRHEAFREVIRDGIAAGDLRSDIDMEAVVPLLVGPALHLGMWHMCEGVDQIATESLVALMLEGMTPSSGS